MAGRKYAQLIHNVEELMEHQIHVIANLTPKETCTVKDFLEIMIITGLPSNNICKWIKVYFKVHN